MDNRRLFLAAFLSLGLVILWSQFVQPPPVAPPIDPAGSTSPAEAGAARGAGPQESAQASGTLTAEADGGDLAAPADARDADVSTPVIRARIEEEVVVSTERYRATFSNRGAQLSSFLLQREVDHDGNPLELVRARGDRDGYPFAIVDGQGMPMFVDDLFTVERTEGSGGNVEVVFELSDGGKRVRKRFVLDPSGLFDVDIETAGIDGWQVLVGPGVRDLDAEGMKDRYRQPFATYLGADDVEKVKPARQRESELLPNTGLRWVSLDDNYFLSAIIPESGIGAVEIRPLRQLETISDDGRRFLSLAEAERLGDVDLDKVQGLYVLPIADTASFVSFLGAKRYQELSSLPYGLEESVRWGFFGFLARPLYYGLRWIYERIPNYGWAIVIMTILIKLVFFPLTHKGQKSMARMQELSPKVQAIRTKYKSKMRDKQGRPNREAQSAMNEEMMTLYRKEGVNPVGGCLPMLIQIPVFFAFFKLLQNAVELRNAPWIGWISDLSAPDPWYLLPVLMLVTSIMVQRVTPAPPDPMQRRIIQMMPIVFSAISISFPAGLVLYWSTNNLLTMIQQWFYHRSRDTAGVKATTDAGKPRKARSAKS